MKTFNSVERPERCFCKADLLNDSFFLLCVWIMFPLSGLAVGYRA